MRPPAALRKEQVRGTPQVAGGVCAVIVPVETQGRTTPHERFDGAAGGLGQTSAGKRPESACRYRIAVTGSRTERGLRMVKPLHSVIDKVYRMANLVKASIKVLANKGASGVDKVTIQAWKANEDAQLRQLHGVLYADTYRSKPVRRVYIPKPGTKKQRPLGIPALVDRVCQQAVVQVVQPTFEEAFFEGSHGFRPGRSPRTARQAIIEYRKAGYRHVVDLDIANFWRRSRP